MLAMAQQSMNALTKSKSEQTLHRTICGTKESWTVYEFNINEFGK
jgi:hypothetical protein